MMCEQNKTLFRLLELKWRRNIIKQDELIRRKKNLHIADIKSEANASATDLAAKCFLLHFHLQLAFSYVLFHEQELLFTSTNISLCVNLNQLPYKFPRLPLE